ncbi:MAG: AAA family ATPase [Proteobacteria bacterium]|jgi:class 3 adenylate cyclase|nr:AAA family ATPase [Pseudomonadota bacterium]
MTRDVAKWLEACGLAQYARAFEDNDVDFEILADLSDADLERLGVSLGHRRKLMRALAEHRKADPAKHPPGTATGAQDIGLSGEAERRQVTVMFCDLVGSTELASALDPEDMAALIRRFQDGCTHAITRFDGFVAKFMGDGILAYFGYPQASEDDPEHAALAAIDAVRAIADTLRPDGRPLQARIGIATGTVLVGDIIGEGAAREYSIVGETPNLAARLQAIAEPNAILIADPTYRLLARRFVYERLGEHTLKGFAAPIRVWRILREASAETRFAATRTAEHAGFVGREEELERLLAAWRAAEDGRGQAPLVSGEPGIGKSRLVDVAFERLDARELAGRDWRQVTCQCSPYHTNSALYPVIRHLERAAGFSLGDDDRTRLDKLDRMLAETNEDQRTSALLAELLSLPSDRYPHIDLAPVQRKAATIAALIGTIRHLSARSPVLLLLEDAHWVDPTTVELWTRVIDATCASPVLIIVTARPEFEPPWPADKVGRIELARLSHAQSVALAESVAAQNVLEPALIREVASKADGVPLFVEELTRSVLESIERPAVPATLRDSLMARLDRLGAAKEIAQIAAVIGTQFSRALLADVLSDAPVDLDAGIDRLLDAGLVFPQSRAAEPAYVFKHALVRDVAYENLLRARRQQLHDRVAHALVDNFPGIVESEPEVVGHHFAEAGQSALASEYRERAGDRAAARSSFVEAVAHFNAALAEATKLHQDGDRMRRELALYLKSGPPLTIIKGGHSADAGDVYQRAHAHATALDSETDLFKATWGLWYHTLTGRRLDLARDHAEELVSLATQATNEDLTLEGIHCRWSTAWFRGDIPTALSNSREGVSRYDRNRHAWMGPVFGGHDPGVCAHVIRCMASSACARHVEARSSAEASVALALELRHPNSHVHALISRIVGAQLRHDCVGVESDIRSLLELADRYDLPPPRAHALFMAGWLQAQTGDFDAGLAQMEAEYPRASAMGPFFRYYAALLAEARERCGRFDDALALVQSSIATTTEAGVGVHVSELYRLQGVCLLAIDRSHRDEGLQSLQAGVDIAKRNGATTLELSATLALARATAGTADAGHARASLQSLCATLPEDFATPALREARVLLAN